MIPSYRVEETVTPVDMAMLPDGAITDLFWAAIESTEEAILNALVANADMTGLDGHRTPALPRDRVAALLRAALS